MTKREADPRLVELALEVKELAASPEHERRRRLWADVVNLRTTRPLVNAYLYADVWENELSGDAFRPDDSPARRIEAALAFKIWRARHFPDDAPIDASLKVVASPPPHRAPFPWSVEMEMLRTEESGSYKEVPTLLACEDVERIGVPCYEIDLAETARAVEEAQALTDGLLPITVRTDELHWGPFEYAVRLRGIDNILYDVFDAPDFLHRLMDKITSGLISYQKAREAAGGVTAEASRFGHVPFDEVSSGLATSLKGTWAYIHAQSAASLSPEMYAEFVHPYNCRLAAITGKNYYHGCEDLSRKCRTIKTLPNLRLFHVSPWTPIEPVLAEMGTAFAYEVHSHPTNVLFGDGVEGIRSELERLEERARGTSHILTLADVETFAGRFDRVAYWAETAREIASA